MKANGYVTKRGETWHYLVQDCYGKYVLIDNTNDWRKIFDSCYFDTAAVRRIEGAGHKLSNSYMQLVNKAAGL